MNSRKGRLVSISIATGIATASMLAFAACSNLEVNTAEAPNTTFQQYKTYAWGETPPSTSIAPDGSILDQTIKATAQRELMTKGLSPAGSSAPDLIINYSAMTKNSVEYRSSPSAWDWGWGETTAYPVREGSITLEFSDARTGRPVWQGTASDVIGKAGPSQSDVADAVTKMVQKYPSA